MSAATVDRRKRPARFTPARDDEIFRAPLLLGANTTEEERAKALRVVAQNLGDDATRIAQMLGLVPA